MKFLFDAGRTTDFKKMITMRVPFQPSDFRIILFAAAVIGWPLLALQASEDLVIADFSSPVFAEGNLGKVSLEGSVKAELTATDGTASIVQEDGEQFARIKWGPSPLEGERDIPGESSLAIHLPEGLLGVEKLRLSMALRCASEDMAFYSWVRFGPYNDRSELSLLSVSSLSRGPDGEKSRNFVSAEPGEAGILPTRKEKAVDTGVEMLAGTWYEISFEFEPASRVGFFQVKTTISQGNTPLAELKTEAAVAGHISGNSWDLNSLRDIVLAVRQPGFNAPEIILDVKSVTVQSK